MFKRLLSFLIPINLHRQNSPFSKTLEVSWNNGQLVLDSKNTNYSYGSLQRVLRYGLKKIGFDKVRNMQTALLLGVAGGSVVKTLVNEVGFKGRVTGVEIDPQVVEMANRYFGLDQITQLEMVIDDAFEFILKTKSRYDLIIIDIFQDTAMPNFLFEQFFCNRIGFLLNPGGYALFNTMILTATDETRNENYLSHWDDKCFTMIRLPRIESHNELFLIHKNA